VNNLLMMGKETTRNM